MQEDAWSSSILILGEGSGALFFLILARLSFLIFMDSRRKNYINILLIVVGGGTQLPFQAKCGYGT